MSRSPSLSRLQWGFGIVLSLLFGCVCVLPALWMRLDLGPDFQGIEMQATDAEFHYAARVREIQDGFLTASNVYYAGGKQQPYLQPPLPEWMITVLAWPFRLDAPRALLLSQFLFGVGVFVALLGCLFAMTRRYWWSLIGVSILLFAGFLFSGPLLPLQLLNGTATSLEFLPFSRPVNPQWSGILFFGSLWGFVTWMRSSARLPLVLASVLLAASFYSYIYVWSFLGVLYALVGIVSVWQRRVDRVRPLFWAAIGVTVAALPYVWNVWMASQHPAYAETALRLGLVERHTPVVGTLLIIGIVVAWGGWYRWRETRWAVVALIGAAFIVQNQQILTGKSIVVSHYHWYFIKPMVCALAFVLVGSWVWDRWGSAWVTARVARLLGATAVLTMIVSLGVLYQWRSFQAALPFWSAQQEAAGTLHRLREITHPGEVVYARGFIRDLVSIYTAADTYWATNAYAYLSTDLRARDAYFFDLWVDGVDAAEAERAFATDRRAELSSRIHAIAYREATGSYAAIGDAEVQKHGRAYRDFLELTTTQKLERYPLHLLVIRQDDARSPAWQELYAHSLPVVQDAFYEIRSIAP